MSVQKKKKHQKSILIASESQGLYTTKRLLEEATRLHYESKWFNPYDSLLSLKEQASTTPLSALYFLRTSGTRYDDFDLTVAQHFADAGTQVTNPLSALGSFRSKDAQALFFRRHQLPGIPTLLYRGELNEKYWSEIEGLSSSQEYVLKMTRGNQGTGVNLISGKQSLRSLLETFHALRDQKFLIQPYLKHKKEWRVFMIRQTPIGIIEKTISAEDFRGNSKRSQGKLIKKLPQNFLETMTKAAAFSGLDYCGMDVMETKEGIVFLEINPVPGFEQMEKLSGINVARELIISLGQSE